MNVPPKAGMGENTSTFDHKGGKSPCFERKIVMPSAARRPHSAAFFYLIAITAVIASFKTAAPGGFNLTGWAWVLAIFISLAFMLISSWRIAFPYSWFLPFFVYFASRLDITSREDMQRFCILICPVIVGIAASMYAGYGFKAIRKSMYFLLGGIYLVYSVAALAQGTFVPTGWYAVAGPCMTVTLISTFGIVQFRENRGHGLVLWGLCWLYCALVVARMPVLIIPLLLAIGPIGFRLGVRLGILVGIVGLGLLALSLPAVQTSLFRGDSGTVQDLISLDPSLVKTGGRLYAWPIYWQEVLNAFWFGHGSVASVQFGEENFGGWAHPHNEYIRLLFDYGIFGLILYLIPIFALLRSCFRGMRSTCNDEKRLFSVGFLGLIAFLLLGLTGNVIMYSAWYGNLLFAVIGAACALRNSRLTPKARGKVIEELRGNSEHPKSMVLKNHRAANEAP